MAPARAHPRGLQHLSVEVRVLRARLRRAALALAVTEERLADTSDGISQSDCPCTGEFRLSAKRARAAAEECRAFAARLMDLECEAPVAAGATAAVDLTLRLGGRYELEELVALGGMGEVWRAEDTVLVRTVAVKRLRAKYARDPQFRDRFRDEARHAALLAHPNITQVFDFGGGDDVDPPYLVMEYVPGQPLSAVLAREAPFSEERTWGILGQTAAALAAAHDAGVVHGDVKPANLLQCPDGRLKITDFGLAGVADRSSAPHPAVLLGTAHYVAPERVVGEPATPASDLYALGILAYACLSGRPPFVGDVDTVLTGHQQRRPPPLPTGVSLPLRALVSTLLAKKPGARPRAADVLAALARQQQPNGLPPAEPGAT